MIDNRNKAFDTSNLAAVQRLCDRKFGVGADGLILIENIDDLDDMPQGSTIQDPDTTVIANPDFRDEIIITAKQHLVSMHASYCLMTAAGRA